MIILNRALAALALLVALAVPAVAQDLTEAQQTALTERVESFDTAMRENDMQTVMGVVPPKVLEKIAAQSNLSVDDLLAAMQAQMDEIMGKVEIVSFGMELDGVEYTTFDSGIVYGMIDVPPFGEPGNPIHQHVAPRYTESVYEETHMPNAVTALTIRSSSVATTTRSNSLALEVLS